MTEATIERPSGGAQFAPAAGRSLAPRTGWIQLMDANRIKKWGQKDIPLAVNGHQYNFRPNRNGDHVTEVPFPDDYAAILSIGAGYAPYGKSVAPADVREEEPYVQPRDSTVRVQPFLDAPDKLEAPKAKRGPVKVATKRPGLPPVDPAAG